jgi:hypothetical protein
MATMIDAARDEHRRDWIPRVLLCCRPQCSPVRRDPHSTLITQLRSIADPRPRALGFRSCVSCTVHCIPGRHTTIPGPRIWSRSADPCPSLPPVYTISISRRHQLRVWNGPRRMSSSGENPSSSSVSCRWRFCAVPPVCPLCVHRVRLVPPLPLVAMHFRITLILRRAISTIAYQSAPATYVLYRWRLYPFEVKVPSLSSLGAGYDNTSS